MKKTSRISDDRAKEIQRFEDAMADETCPPMTSRQLERFAPVNPELFKPIKKSIQVRVDADILEWLKTPTGKGYQTRLNKVLRWAIENNCPIRR